MSAHIEVIAGVTSMRFALASERVTVGRAAENDITLDDATASQLHAVLESFAAGWSVTDLGSSNGTWVNGERIWSAHRLRHGDEMRMGQTRLVFRDPLTAAGAATQTDAGPPSLTTRERDVLIALCRPLLARDVFTEPASTRQIAEDLVITQAAVKQHLGNLYDKFDIAGAEANRRAQLANTALRRGALSLAELQAAQGE